MTLTLTYSALHAQNPRLTHAVFVAATVPHTKVLAKRQAQFKARGAVVLAHATAQFGPAVEDALWLQLRPQRVDAWLAAHQHDWLAQVVGMLHTFDLAQPLAATLAAQPPTLAAPLTPAEKSWTVAHRLPARVGAWIFHSDATAETGWALLAAVAEAPLSAPTLSQVLALPTATPAVLRRAVQVLVPALAPVPAAWLPQVTAQPQAPKQPTPVTPSLPAVPPGFVAALKQQLAAGASGGPSSQRVLPLAVNLASLVNAIRDFGHIRALRLVAPSMTSGGLRELAPTLDQALVLDHAETTIVSGLKAQPSAATVADFNELQAAGVAVYTTQRPLGARLVQVEFARVTMTISGSSDVVASDYHTSLELDTLTVAQHDPYAAWWQSFLPYVRALTLKAAPVAHRQRLLSQPVATLANFKARVAAVHDRDTQQRLTAWLYYQPQPPVAMTLDGVEYFALAFTQYQTVVIDTFTPNNALFFQSAEDTATAAAQLAGATSKHALQAMGAKRAYHTAAPIRQRVRRILGGD